MPHLPHLYCLTLQGAANLATGYFYICGVEYFWGARILFVGLKIFLLGNFRIFRLHSYSGVNDIFPNDLPRIGVGPGWLDWFEPAIRD